MHQEYQKPDEDVSVEDTVKKSNAAIVREHTLEEIGKELGVTRERVRQIEAKALRKLRHRSRCKVLAAFVD